MVLKTSPGGSTFPYAYKGGELFCLHLGSFGDNEAGAIARIEVEEAFLLQQNRRIGIWVDLYQTKLTDRVIRQLVEFLEHARGLVPKLALVGCSAWDRRKITKAIKKSARLSSLPTRYFSDPEDAKTWLVSETNSQQVT